MDEREELPTNLIKKSLVKSNWLRCISNNANCIEKSKKEYILATINNDLTNSLKSQIQFFCIEKSYNSLTPICIPCLLPKQEVEYILATINKDLPGNEAFTLLSQEWLRWSSTPGGNGWGPSTRNYWTMDPSDDHLKWYLCQTIGK